MSPTPTISLTGIVTDATMVSTTNSSTWIYTWTQTTTTIFETTATVSASSSSGITYTGSESITITIKNGIAPSGSGTANDPYLVSTYENLIWITENESKWGNYYKQVANINTYNTRYWNDTGTSTSSLEGWLPIGNETTNFTGNYDGGFHSISNLFILRYSANIGLFGKVSNPNNSTSQISNLNIVNPTILGDTNVGSLIGSLVGDNASNYPQVSGCYTFDGNVIGRINTGGLVGYSSNYSKITLSSSDLNVKAISYLNATITTSTNSETSFGGLIGKINNNVTISKSYSEGDVYGIGSTGGFVGCMGVDSKISDSYSTASGSIKLRGCCRRVCWFRREYF